MDAFVMTPFKDPFLRIYEKATRPAVEARGLDVHIVRDEQFTGPIIDKIHKLIEKSDVCIAEMTKKNPNVMYEVGCAITLEKPVIFITQGRPERIPFDVRHHRVITYQNNPAGLRRLREDLEQTLTSTVTGGDSPFGLIRRMLVPKSIRDEDDCFVVAASPLSYREAYRTDGGWEKRPLGTYSDHVGIRGLMQCFGTIFTLNKLPHLLDPDDFANGAVYVPCHLYCIGSPKCNRLTGLVMDDFFKDRSPKWEFRPDSESRHLRNPALVLRKNGKPHNPGDEPADERLVWDCGLVIRGPHPHDASRMFTIMAGRSSRGTEAACLAVTNADCIRELSDRLKKKHVDLDEHRQGFCAVVSISGECGDQYLGPDVSTFEVHDVMAYL